MQSMEGQDIIKHARRLSAESCEPEWALGFRLACAKGYDSKLKSAQGKEKEGISRKIKSLGISPARLHADRTDRLSDAGLEELKKTLGVFTPTLKDWKAEDLLFGALHCCAWRAGETPGGKNITLQFMRTGKNTEIETAIDCAIGEGGKEAQCLLNLIHVDEKARLRLGISKSNMSKSMLAVATKLALSTSAKAQVDSTEIGCGGIIANTTSYLWGRGAKCVFTGAFFGFVGAEFSIDTTAVHKTAKTQNATFAKGALDDKAKCHYSGMLDVHKDAAGSSTDFREKVLMLSDNATSCAMPRLDIKNNDVTAGHGATCGKIDADELFYLQTRGITDDLAKGLVTRGFMHEALAKMSGRNRKIFECGLATRLGDI